MREGRFTIVTKWYPCTNTRPMKVKAVCHFGSLTMSYTGPADHGQCAQRLLEQEYGVKSAGRFELVKAIIKEGSWAFIVLEK